MEPRQDFLKRLQESEERYRVLFENAPDVVYAISAENETIQSLNPAFEKITGWRREEFIGKAFFSLVHPDDLPVAFKTFQQVLKGKSPPPYELRIRSKSGKYVTGEFTSAPLVKGGKIIGEFGIVRDITERKKAEETVRSTQYALDNASVAVYWADPDGKFTYVNDTGCSSLRYSREELLKMSVFDIDAQYTIERWRKYWKHVRRKKTVTIETIHRRKDGSTFPVEIKITYLRLGDREYNIAFAADITARKDAQEALARREEQYRLSYDNVPLHMAIIDRSGKFVLWNRYSKKMFGYSAREAIEKLSPADIHETEEEALKVVLTATKDGIFDGELNLKRKNGVLFPAHLIVVPYKNAEGEIVNFFGFAEDITERKKITGMKENLIRDVSHELKTPMALCQMSLDMLGSAIRKNNDARVKKAFKMAQGNIQRFRKDIDNILSFSSIELKREISRQKTSISKALGEVLRDFHYLIDAKDLDMKTAIPKNADFVFMDKYDLRSVLSNLIDNAVKFTEHGGIRISAARAGANINVSVKDTGMGISKKSIVRVFEKFYKQTSSIPGVGLGLPICKEILERNGGRIKVNSKGEGKGTIVTVTLPAFKGEKNETHFDRGRRKRHAGYLC